MGLKRLFNLTLPAFLLVGGGSAAEALTPPYALTATAVSSGQIRLSWAAYNQGQLFSICAPCCARATECGPAASTRSATPRLPLAIRRVRAMLVMV